MPKKPSVEKKPTLQQKLQEFLIKEKATLRIRPNIKLGDDGRLLFDPKVIISPLNLTKAVK